MDRKLDRQYVEDRGTVMLMDSLPFTWNVKSEGPHFCLDMKMSRLKELGYSFVFGSEPREQWPVTGHPERILKLDISLNELEELQNESMYPLENLCELNASLNALKGIQGVSVLPHLLDLQLSYNAISNVRGLQHNKMLTILNVSHNQIRTILGMPVLSNLTEVHIDSNKLESLEGIQNLPQLQELHAQNNQIRNLLPLSSSLNLHFADISNNEIHSLHESLQILKTLFRLKQLKLKGNPIARDNRYVTMVKQSTAVEILDNALIRDPRGHRQLLVPQSAKDGQTKEELIEAARAAYQDKLQRKQQEVASTIHYMHGRILDLQEELKEQKDSLRLELEGYIRYLETIPPEDFHSIDSRKVSGAIDQNMFTKFWKKWDHGKRRPGDIPFHDLTKPEEVVRTAVWLLSNPPVPPHT
ncbi:leucine-rich repeat-containing protein 23-like isoform X1 [Acipenser oxyrinchus oxyrinchus]|uniref:Leucine-rich repeat-containing protein 23-like isoform X1 n=1 Tax=Acipenser oxyrinchus oxyrinchus TaxID=40147 RepID=A0AAD8DCV0_ACIOX|nr:leucine-rich repeat-containing protein 23-like isoform X1 [Acipenser oxyrinchus oxyrinchus]